MTEPKFLGPVRSAPVSSLQPGIDVLLPFQSDGIRSMGYRATVKSFNADRSEMTVFVEKTGETVVVSVRPNDQFDLV